MNNEELESLEFANNVFRNMNELFFNPEIVKRKEQNLLPDDFLLVAAQAIFFPGGRQPIVRLNNEVSAEVKIKKGINKEVENFWPSRDEIETVKLNEKEFSDCGHVTMILFKDGFQLTFDFHYNKQICSEHLSVASQFIKSSKYALDNSFTYAFIDNSFSAIELLAKTNLLIEANHNMRGKTSHKTIKSAFNQRFKNSQTLFETTRREVFNRLSDARANARYLEGKITFNKSELEEIYGTIEDMHSELCVRANFDEAL